MSLYEHVFISRQDLSVSQAEGLIDHFSTILTENGGKVLNHEYWGLKTFPTKLIKIEKVITFFSTLTVRQKLFKKWND